MGPADQRSGTPRRLRDLAEDRFGKMAQAATGDLEPVPAAETRRLLHELRVHQIELEVQNEELQEAHATLEARTHQLEMFIENAPAAVAMLDRDLRYVCASRRWLQDYRLELGDLVGRSHYEVFPEIPERWKAVHGRCLDGAVERSEGDPFPRPDGQVDWLNWEVRPWLDGAGQIGGILIMSERINDRKVAETAVRESGELFRAQFSLAAEGAFTQTPEGLLVEVNETLARMHGYAPAEMQGRHYLDFVAEGSPAREPGAMARLLAGEPMTTEGEHRHRDGHTFPAEVSARLVHFSGRPVILGFVRDRSERRRAEQELRGSHALMERAEKLAQSGNWELDLGTGRMRGSLGARRIYGLAGTEWTVAEVQELVLPEYRAHLDAALAALVRHGRPYDVEFRIQRRADGGLRDLHSIAEYDAGRNVMFGVITDITQRHRLEAALASRVLALARPEGAGAPAFEDLFSLEDLQNLQDAFAQATGVAAIITRPDGVPLTRPSNFTRFCELVRTSPQGRANCFRSDAALGRQQLDGPVLQPCLSAGLWDAGVSLSAGGHPIAAWLIGQVRDGTRTPEAIDSYARELGLDPGRLLEAYEEVPVMPVAQFQKVADALAALAGHLSNSASQNLQQAGLIAESQAAESRVRRMAEGLERRVRERTLQLASANRELEAFSYSVSHDLRAPLRGIDGFSQALLEDCQGQLDETGRHYLDRIRLGTRRMGQIIEDLLALSRIGRSGLNLERADLSGLAGVILEELALASPDRRVAAVVQPGLRAWADAGLLRALLANLLGNAWKFSSRQPEARIEVGEEVLAGGERAFFIRDNGAGFDPARADQLFTAFQRLHSAQDYEGTGIGLAIVSRVVQRHGGRVWAQAEPGLGATFRFTLPDPGPAAS